MSLRRGQRVRLSGDSASLWIKDYNVRVDSFGTILETPGPRAKKVLVSIDHIDGDNGVIKYVRINKLIPV